MRHVSDPLREVYADLVLRRRAAAMTDRIIEKNIHVYQACLIKGRHHRGPGAFPPVTPHQPGSSDQGKTS